VLSREGLFDTVTLSVEDRRRGDLYRQRSQAENMRASAGSVEDYYRELRMQLSFAPVHQASLARAAQLTQKTNQFNVTTRRSTESDISRRARDPGWIVTTIAVRDRFGDHGIVGVLMAKHTGDVVEIDTLLLSCRVIGRTIETAMLAHVCDCARARGATAVTGTVIPTARNDPARDLFARHGFAKMAEDVDGTTHWRLDPVQRGVPWPEWFERAVESAASELGD
jgi:FkbH-like protein